MADHGQSGAPQREMEPKVRRDMTGKIGERHGGVENPQQKPRSGVKPGDIVSHDVPDESTQHHTEIAVEARRTGREHQDDKR